MLSIRPATQNDALLLSILIRELAEFERLDHECIVTEENISRDGFGPQPKFRALIAEWDGQTAGYALFFEFYSTFQGRAGLFLEDIFVRPEYRKKGIGTDLLARVAKLAWEEDFFCLRWEVLDWNKSAIEFYQKLGATFLDEWKAACLIGDALQAAAAEPGFLTARVRIIGAGLAGSEASWQCARRGIAAELCEMRPVRTTPAHQTADFAELVCSNSLKSDSPNTAPWLLKEEMRRAGSLLMKIAGECAVPAGHALAVDRAIFAEKVTEAIAREPLITVRREEIVALDENEITIVATGPLTSDGLAAEISRLADGTEVPERAGAPAPHRLYFYDSISPIVEADSIDMSKVYLAARYDKGSADYINCPMTEQEYGTFYDALLAAQSVEERDWEKLNYFASCLPIEEIARRGRDTLRFGPMKPVGLKNPATGRMPYAVVQLRQENLRADSYNLVGFQNHLKFGEQARVLRLIPGLENARFLRYGQIHRNTYINSPSLLAQTLQMKTRPQVLFAGQICGVEGYVESIATGLMAGIHASALASGSEPVAPPRATAFGSLVHYITSADPGNFQPANITFDLLPALETKVRDRQIRHRMQCELALQQFEAWRDRMGSPCAPLSVSSDS